MKPPEELYRYLAQILGTPVELRDLPTGATRKLPGFLTAVYRLLDAQLLGHRFVLALAQTHAEIATPSEYAKQVGMLRAALGNDVALVLEAIPTHVRNRLVQHGVPFIVPGRQMFLPFLATDLREREPRPPRGARAHLTSAAQVVMLRKLLGKPVTELTLAELAAATGYAAMTMTYVAQELHAAGLCRADRQGRARRLVFEEEGRALWERALPLLYDPAKDRRWVITTIPTVLEHPFAGITALARYTEVADDALQTIAVSLSEYRHLVRRGDMTECRISDEAHARVELWSYDPKKLADGDDVDQLSLFLSLRNTTDERVHKALRALLESFSW